jgi:uncharacterized protein (DUF1684 family)
MTDHRHHELIEFRRQKDAFFGRDQRSPIPERERAGFTGLSYYPPNDDLVYTLRPEPGDGEPIRIGTSDGQVREYHRSAIARFEVDGEEATLALLTTPHHPGFFLPFRDATSGTDTYGAGRYLDLEPNPDGTVTIDFNLAYNPSCAYDDAYSCPLPPPENWLRVPIRAGEKAYPHTT